MVSARIESVTVVVPVRDGTFAVGATETIGEALNAAANAEGVQVVLIGTGAAEAHEMLVEEGFADLSTCLAELGSFAPAAWTEALAPLLAGAELVLLPASADGRDLAPRLAARLGRSLIAGALAVNSEHALIPRADGRALVETALVLPAVATLQPGIVRSPRTTTGDAAAPEVLEVAANSDATGAGVSDAEVLGVDEADAATMDLSEAPFIVGAGAGLGTPEVFEDLRVTAEKLGASVGATRVVTDEGWIGHDRQIGTTGVVVDPRAYVAFGISGAVQHTSGLGAPDHVISVNTDPHCPMMQLADLAIVADAPAVVAELRRRLADDKAAHGEQQSDEVEAS